MYAREAASDGSQTISVRAYCRAWHAGRPNSGRPEGTRRADAESPGSSPRLGRSPRLNVSHLLSPGTRLAPFNTTIYIKVVHAGPPAFPCPDELNRGKIVPFTLGALVNMPASMSADDRLAVYGSL